MLGWRASLLKTMVPLSSEELHQHVNGGDQNPNVHPSFQDNLTHLQHKINSREKRKRKMGQEDDMMMMMMMVRKGPWTEQEDVQLVSYVNMFGDRRWDFIAKVSGLKVAGDTKMKI
ncbi:hypothetical protein L6452_37669 [Arctium lappa]|uniref:Uncharacterized protein n=1 Tax=Arctium lappa TaxID=4217 RepID=A0ACB8Y449_ARCLA|nr:hypothetical protein L6452_37669 [Arctium lappa]